LDTFLTSYLDFWAKGDLPNQNRTNLLFFFAILIAFLRICTCASGWVIRFLCLVCEKPHVIFHY